MIFFNYLILTILVLFIFYYDFFYSYLQQFIFIVIPLLIFIISFSDLKKFYIKLKSNLKKRKKTKDFFKENINQNEKRNESPIENIKIDTKYIYYKNMFFLADNFSKKELKDSYRKLAKENHPDLNKNFKINMTEINEGYEYLKKKNF